MTLPTASMEAPAGKKRFSASDAELASAQRNFDFLMPYKKALLTTKEVAQVIGREQDFVRELIQEGRLESHADSAFGLMKSNRVTRRSVLVYFARTAQYEPAQFIDGFRDLFLTLTPEQLTKLIVLATQERARR
ncbi:MAG TPA: hypothetical protein VK474_09035 [Chthoniobacterales bacterium]|nr:hypothetical protein [Chthoniobacterales bacterium]